MNGILKIDWNSLKTLVGTFPEAEQAAIWAASFWIKQDDIILVWLSLGGLGIRVAIKYLDSDFDDWDRDFKSLMNQKI